MLTTCWDSDDDDEMEVMDGRAVGKGCSRLLEAYCCLSIVGEVEVS